MTGNYKRPTGIASINPFKTRFDNSRPIEEIKQLRAQKNVVVLMNEGTASAAEVFVSSLHDNGRTVALIGTKTYGKGLIQHTFPMPDGGGLRLTVAEYLTPALQHVTKVGGAQYDKNGDFVGGGVKPDIYCPSTQGIPSNIGADICVGLAVDALEDANSEESKLGVNLSPDESLVSRRGGTEGGSFRRRTLNQGVVRVSFQNDCVILFVQQDGTNFPEIFAGHFLTMEAQVANSEVSGFYERKAFLPHKKISISTFYNVKSHLVPSLTT